MASEVTPGGQWRIPASEIERLKRDGLPPIPRPLPGGGRRPVVGGSRGGRATLYAEPSDRVIGAAETVVMLENQVKALGLQRQMEKRRNINPMEPTTPERGGLAAVPKNRLDSWKEIAA